MKLNAEKKLEELQEGLYHFNELGGRGSLRDDGRLDRALYDELIHFLEEDMTMLERKLEVMANLKELLEHPDVEELAEFKKDETADEFAISDDAEEIAQQIDNRFYTINEELLSDAEETLEQIVETMEELIDLENE